MNLNKNACAIWMSHEQVFMHRAMSDPRYSRRVERVIVTQPTEADYAEYQKARDAHEYLLNSPYFDDGGPDERSSISPPEPTREYIYAETIDEWIARCKELEEA